MYIVKFIAKLVVIVCIIMLAISFYKYYQARKARNSVSLAPLTSSMLSQFNPPLEGGAYGSLATLADLVEPINPDVFVENIGIADINTCTPYNPDYSTVDQMVYGRSARYNPAMKDLSVLQAFNDAGVLATSNCGCNGSFY